jgi:hypothetical protein
MFPWISRRGKMILSRATAGDDSPLFGNIMERHALRNIITSNGRPSGCFVVASSFCA